MEGGVCGQAQQGGVQVQVDSRPPPTNTGKKKPPQKILDPIQLQSTGRGPRKERVLALAMKGSQVYSARHYLDCRDCVASANLTFCKGVSVQ